MDKGQELQDIDFNIMNLEKKAYDRKVKITENSRIVCKQCLRDFSSELEVMEHAQRSFKCVLLNKQCSICKRYFKGDHGLNQHLIRSKCQFEVATHDFLPDHCLPNKGSNPVTQTGPDNHHSTLSRCGKEEERVKLEKWIKKDPIKLPRMSDLEKWNTLEKTVHAQLPAYGSTEKKIRLMEMIIYEEAANLFGKISKRSKDDRKPSRRLKQIKDVRNQIKDLARTMKVCSEEDKYTALVELMEELKKKRRILRAAEHSRKKRWHRKQVQRRFFQDPFKAAKEVLSPKVKSEPKVPKSVLNKYIQKVRQDPERTIPLGELEGLPDIDANMASFNSDKFKTSDLYQVVKKKRNASQPGPNQIPYKVYKKCPKLRNYLFRIMLKAAKDKLIPLNWRVSDGIMIPKVQIPRQSNLADYRQIALGNVEGKLFWSLIAQRFYNHLVTKNKLIDTKFQKGSIQKMAGRWEHTSMIWAALKDARSKGRSLSTILLDLANAYGLVPHMLIIFTLRRYKIPGDWITLVIKYYDGLWGRMSASGVSSDWHRYEKGIFAGCTISVILFIAAFSVILKYVSRIGLLQYNLSNTNAMPVLRAFMDDMSLMTRSTAAAKIALERTVIALKWARMKLKPQKSRSLVRRKGKSIDEQPFKVGEEVIPSIQKELRRALGRIYNSSVTDKTAREDLRKKIIDLVQTLDKLLLTGIMKVWVYQKYLQCRCIVMKPHVHYLYTG